MSGNFHPLWKAHEHENNNDFWSDPAFMDECGESHNLAINAVADVLHTLYSEAHTERRGDLDGDI